LVVGAGGLGSPVLMYLAAAGVGTLGVIDPDVVDLSNLQRQIIHSTDEIGRPKVRSAAERIESLNPDITVIEHRDRFWRPGTPRASSRAMIWSSTAATISPPAT
jgi:molybdopterin/thiamine biosynthesis adenylyltransferase